jgi:hypothetical protein
LAIAATEAATSRVGQSGKRIAVTSEGADPAIPASAGASAQ